MVEKINTERGPLPAYLEKAIYKLPCEASHKKLWMEKAASEELDLPRVVQVLVNAWELGLLDLEKLDRKVKSKRPDPIFEREKLEEDVELPESVVNDEEAKALKKRLRTTPSKRRKARRTKLGTKKGTKVDSEATSKASEDSGSGLSPLLAKLEKLKAVS